jgi:excisionase family DNA binding protein
MSIEVESKWITLKAAATYLNVSCSWLYQKGDSLGIPRTKIGSTFRYNRIELDRWMAEHSNA